MTEQLRQFYLQALGVDRYVPRQALPGAAASVGGEWERAAEQPGQFDEASQLPSEQRHSGDPSPAVAGAALNAGGPAPLVGAAEAAAMERPTQRHRFVLACWRLAPRILVLDSRSAGNALPTDALLRNISLALGLGGAPGAPDLLRWPPNPASALPPDLLSDIAAARAMVQAYLSAQHEKQPLDTVLLMGAAAVQQVLAAEHLPDVEDLSGLAALLGKSFPLQLAEEAATTQRAIVLPSLTAMLKKPALKVPCWRAIKALRAEP